MSHRFMPSVLSSFAVVLLLILLAPGALATDVKVMGFTDVTLQWADTPQGRARNQDNFQTVQRTRAWLMFHVSENLKSVLMLELDNIWGADMPGMRGGSLGTDGLNIGVKEAYINWAVPDTSIRVRMGLLPIILPGIGPISPLTNQVDSVVSMWARGAGVVVSGQISEQVGLTGFWMRTSNDNAPRIEGKKLRDSADLFGLVVPVTGDGYDVRPWVMFSRAGKDDPLFTYRPTLTPAFPSNSPATTRNGRNYANGWWAGAAANITAADPWHFGVDINYGRINGVTRDMDRGGWYASAMAEYKFASATPGLLAWYTSGDDADPWNGSERMPTILANWYGSNFGFMAGYDNFNHDSIITAGEPTGTWGVSAYVRDISFVENIKHLVRVSYYQGTNSNEMAKYVKNGFTSMGSVPLWLYLTEDDRVTEVNLGTYWEIYKNFTWAVEANWHHLHRGDNWDLSGHKSNSFRVASTWRYIF